MTTTQAAKLIGCDPSSVRRMVRSKVIKAKSVSYPDGTFAYEISEAEVKRIKAAPKVEKRGYPRGRKRLSN